MPKMRNKYRKEFKLPAIELSYERENLTDLVSELNIRK